MVRLHFVYAEVEGHAVSIADTLFGWPENKIPTLRG